MGFIFDIQFDYSRKCLETSTHPGSLTRRQSGRVGMQAEIQCGTGQQDSWRARGKMESESEIECYV